MPAPLDGYRVVEACQMVAGPLTGTQLADLGADVVKVEAPAGGDRMRYLGHRKKDVGALWAMVNRGKRSAAIDLRHPDGRDAFLHLIERADVFIQNFRPGVVDRLGIDEASLRAVNPRLIYVSISGFGETGPYIDQKSYDYVIQALSGMAGLQGAETGTPALLRNIVVDKTTAYTATQAVLASLLARERGLHDGEHIRLSMLDAAIAFLWPDGMMQHTLLDDTGLTPGPHMADGYAVRPTKSGHIALMAFSERQFPLLCAALGTDWLSDSRFETLAGREANAAALSDLLGAELAGRDGAELVATLHAHDVPCALINPVDSVHCDPQVVHNGAVVEHVRPHLGAVREPRPAIRFTSTPIGLGRHAPRLDEHTDEVLGECGLGAEALGALRASGAIGRATT